MWRQFHYEKEDEDVHFDDDSVIDDDNENVNYESQLSFWVPSLPNHKRCASQTLNLLASTDMNNYIKSSELLNTKHTNVIKKCSQLWTRAAHYPCVTRWNSFYNSIMQILKQREKLKQLCSILDMKDALKDAEVYLLWIPSTFL